MLASVASGKTITLTDLDADRMANIGVEAPRQSWVSYEPASGLFTTIFISVRPGGSFLIRFPLDKLPRNQRITKAELILPVYWQSGTEPRMFTWRVLGDWGAGVCHQYRMVRPKKVEWSVPGARGASIDRATRPTAITKIVPNEMIVNVTADVDLWYTGTAPNQGWILTSEDTDAVVQFHSPLWGGKEKWRLRITYEPQ